MYRVGYNFNGVCYCIYTNSNYAEVYEVHPSKTSVTIHQNVTNNSITYDVTSIDLCAFYECKSLQVVSIPTSVINIPSGIFSNCPDVERLIVAYGNKKYDSRNKCNAIIETETNRLVVGCKTTIIPNTVKIIGVEAFGCCTSLKEINIPHGVECLEHSAFGRCTNLVSITLPSTMKYIKDFAMANCRSLSAITIPNSVTLIGHGAFSECESLLSIVIPKGVTVMEDLVFHSCTSIVSVIILGEITKIGESVFADCSSLVSIVMPDSIEEIGKEAFRNCSSLKSICLPKNVKQIYCDAFDGTGMYEEQANWENDAFYIDECLIFVKNHNTTDFIIRDNTRLIASYAFHCCSSLTSVTIPNSVTSIGKDAFNFCTTLKEITYQGTMKQWDAIVNCGDKDWYKEYGISVKYVHCIDGDIQITTCV